MRILAISLLATVFISHSFATERVSDIQHNNTKINYSVGYKMGSDFKHNSLDIRPEALLKGIQDALSESDAQMTPEERQNTMMELSKQIQQSKRKQ